MSLGTRAKGTRLYYAALSGGVAPTWVAVAAGVAPGSTWKEIVCPTRISKPKRYDTTPYDDSCLSDASPAPKLEKVPPQNAFTVSVKQSDGTDGGAEMLTTLSDAVTEKQWVVLYKDGRAFYITGVLVEDDIGSAENNVTAEVAKEYHVMGTHIGSWSASA